MGDGRTTSWKNVITLQVGFLVQIHIRLEQTKIYKSWLVAKGFKQEHRVDYNEIFSPIVKMTTLRLLLGVVATEDLMLEQLDVKTTFLHGDLEENIYMSQLEGLKTTGEEFHHVCRLKKSLYGLKQAPRMWY